MFFSNPCLDLCRGAQKSAHHTRKRARVRRRPPPQAAAAAGRRRRRPLPPQAALFGALFCAPLRARALLRVRCCVTRSFARACVFEMILYAL